jgi:hypothetical protein
MKIENTLENKAKFFALYWGQKVMKKNIEGLENFYSEIGGFIRSMTIDSPLFLELKVIENINDKDLIKCYHIHSAFISYDYTMDFQSVLVMTKHWISNNGLNDIQKCPGTIDYLRSKGYALSWMDLSVDDLVEYGWVKLIYNNTSKYMGLLEEEMEDLCKI